VKFVYIVARVLLGIMFTVFGLNGFLHFIPQPPIPGMAGQFFGILFESHFAVLIFAAQLIAGILLLVGRWVPFALVVLAAVLANILTFHITMSPETIAPAIVALVLWILALIPYREKLAVLFT
jgi:uncharacterized membrane protein YphA (DoxX/SURF4 family)